jgi:DNA repair exonuclease SbcCD nuclease subunit
MIKVKLNDPKGRVNFVWSSDWHLTEVPPARRKDDYRNAILAKIQFIRELVEKINGAALCGGDVFHYKQPRHAGNAIRLIIDLYHALRSFPQKCVYGSVGNHDLSFDRMDSLPHQPLGLLIASGAYHDLNQEPVCFTNADESVRVTVETFPYLANGKALGALLGASPRLPGVTARVGVVHAYGHPGDAGSLFGEPTIGYNQLKDADFDYLLWGHDHSRKETETVGNVTHINLGSLARAAFSYDEVDRPVVATILSFDNDGCRYKEVPIPVKALEVAFQTADKDMDQVAKSPEMEEFFAGMDESMAGLEITDARAVVKELCADEPRLLSLIMELCEL